MSRKIKIFIKHTFRLTDDLEADFALVYIRARILRLSKSATKCKQRSNFNQLLLGSSLERNLKANGLST